MSVTRRRRLLPALLVAVLALSLTAATPASHDDPPNDPLFTDPGFIAPWNWGMQQVRALEAWHTTTGSGATVAIVDSGVDLDHPDLAANLVEGRNFVGCENEPDGCGDGDWQNTEPYSDHGTHVAGTVGAVAGNGEGVYGVAPDAKLMPVRALDDDGGTFGEIAAAIRWAVDNGADVINMSLGGLPGTQGLTITGLVPQTREAVQYAVANDVVVVAAAGNEPVPLCGTPAWEPGVLCVIATGPEEERTAYSGGALNENAVDVVAAPGGEIPFCDPDLMVLSTIPPENGEGCSGVAGYGTKAGTSMATPHVAGVAALLKALGCTQPQTMDILKSTARQGNTEVRGTYTPVYGYGIVDAEAAVAAATSTCETPDGGAPTATADAVTTTEGTPITIDVLANDSDPDGDPLTIVSTTQPSFGTVEHDGATVTYTPDEFRSGTDSFTYTIGDGNGNTDTASVSVEVTAIERPAIVIDSPADGSTVAPGQVTVTGTLTRQPAGAILHLIGDGNSYTTVDAGAEGVPPFALSSAGTDGEATEFLTTGSWNLQSWDNPFIPTLAGDEAVELSGQTLELTVAVEFNYPQQGATCPVGAQLFTAGEGEGFAPNGEEARTTPPNSTGAPALVTFEFTPTAGAYDAIGVQFAGIGADCGTIPARWVWGTDEADGFLRLAADDLLVDGDRDAGDGVIELAVDGDIVRTVPASLDGDTGEFSMTVELSEGRRTIAATWADAAGAQIGTATADVKVNASATVGPPIDVGGRSTAAPALLDALRAALRWLTGLL